MPHFNKMRQGKNILYFFERLGDFSSTNHFTLRAPESQHFLEVQSILFYSSWKLARNMSWKLTGAAKSLLKSQSHSQQPCLPWRPCRASYAPCREIAGLPFRRAFIYFYLCLAALLFNLMWLSSIYLFY